MNIKIILFLDRFMINLNPVNNIQIKKFEIFIK